MRRREATRIFSEISAFIHDAPIYSISLMPHGPSGEDFDLRINLDLDAKSLKNVQSVVSKHGMILKEDKGSLVILGTQGKPNGIPIIAQI